MEKSLTLEQRIENAQALHGQKANCAQSVAGAFADCVDIPFETLMRAAEGFGLGMGGTQGVCGTLSAAVLLAGFTHSAGRADGSTKAATYALTAQMVESFLKQNGTYVCSELKGLDIGTPRHPCPDCIRDGCVLAARYAFGMTEEAGAVEASVQKNA